MHDDLRTKILVPVLAILMAMAGLVAAPTAARA
jgi:hypothetical protein